MQSNSLIKYFADVLRKDASLHEEGRHKELGGDFASIEERLAKLQNPSTLLLMAYSFWDAWLDERNHKFPGRYSDISADSWPSLARSLSNTLEGNADQIDPLISKYFGPRPKTP